MRSEERVAILLGVISPKTRMISVRIPVAIPMAVADLEARPKLAVIRVTMIVVNDEAVRLTILLPIKIALSVCKLPYKSSVRTAFLFESTYTDFVDCCKSSFR